MILTILMMCVRIDEHSLFQTLLVDRHLDGDMRQVYIEEPVGSRWDGGVVLRVFVELSYGADAR